MLKVGFIGAGARARKVHYPCVNRLDNVSIEAVSELDESLMQTVVEKYDIPCFFKDYREMLESVKLDVIYVIMGRDFVTPIAIACMRAGKQVVISEMLNRTLKTGDILKVASGTADVLNVSLGIREVT